MIVMRLLRATFSAGLPFGILMSLIFMLQRGFLPGLTLGLAAGLLFGLALAVFVELQRKKLQVGRDYQGEPVLYQGPANHWRGREARGGWLILTPRRLLFRPHGKNYNNTPLELSVTSLRGTEFTRTLGVVPNGLRVLLSDGSQERFVVSERDEWAARLSEAMRGERTEAAPQG